MGKGGRKGGRKGGIKGGRKGGKKSKGKGKGKGKGGKGDRARITVRSSTGQKITRLNPKNLTKETIYNAQFLHRSSRAPSKVAARRNLTRGGMVDRPARTQTISERKDFYNVLNSDEKGPFLRPVPKRVVKMPTSFRDVKEYCATLAHNLLAEYWMVFKDSRGPMLEGYADAGGIKLSGTVEDSLIQNLFVINHMPAIVTEQVILDGGAGVRVKLKPPHVARGYVRIRNIGYIGSYLTEFSTILELASKEPTNLVKNILQPRLSLRGDYANYPLRTNEVPINPSQEAAVSGLKNALEKIQGPPGTGKSTTIFHVIASRVPAGKRVLVTCSRNVAVESITQKVRSVEDGKLLVFGNAARIGPTARGHLLEHESARGKRIQAFEKLRKLVAHGITELGKAIRQKEMHDFPCSKSTSGLWGRLRDAYFKHKYAKQYAFLNWCERVSLSCALQEEKITAAAKEDVMRASKIILCTIASTPRLMREWDELMPSEKLEVHTVIVDECGCTAESSTPMLLKLNPKNLILVGDHRQLPPCSLLPPQELIGSGIDRSLLERAVLESGQVHVLKEQYRMHPDNAKLVSKLFYGGVLSTPKMISVERKSRSEKAQLWLQMNEWENIAPGTKSYYNPAQAQAALSAAVKLRNKHPDQSVAILTFYRGQRDALLKDTPAALEVDVLTVDACQGCEYDYVILTTVRSNARGVVGFVRDKQRLCVAMSRAKRQLVVIANSHTLCNESDWQELYQACGPAHKQDWCNHKIPDEMKEGPSVYDEQHAARLEQLQAIQDAFEAEQNAKGSKGGAKGSRDKGHRNQKPSRHASYGYDEYREPAAPYEPGDFNMDFPVLDGPSPGNSREPGFTFPKKYTDHKLSQKQRKKMHDISDAGPNLGYSYSSKTKSSADLENEPYKSQGMDSYPSMPSMASSTPTDEGAWQIGDISKDTLIEMFGRKAANTVLEEQNGNCQQAFAILLERQANEEKGVHDDEDDLDYDYDGYGGDIDYHSELPAEFMARLLVPFCQESKEECDVDVLIAMLSDQENWEDFLAEGNKMLPDAAEELEEVLFECWEFLVRVWEEEEGPDELDYIDDDEVDGQEAEGEDIELARDQTTETDTWNEAWGDEVQHEDDGFWATETIKEMSPRSPNASSSHQKPSQKPIQKSDDIIDIPGVPHSLVDLQSSPKSSPQVVEEEEPPKDLEGYVKHFCSKHDIDEFTRDYLFSSMESGEADDSDLLEFLESCGVDAPQALDFVLNSPNKQPSPKSDIKQEEEEWQGMQATGTLADIIAEQEREAEERRRQASQPKRKFNKY